MDAIDAHHDFELRRQEDLSEAQENALVAEQDRRLARYDEAIRLLEKWRKFGDLETNEMPYGDTAAFLAAEGKVAG